MTTPSSIVIRYNGVDITTSVLFSTASFEMNAGAIPGTFSFTVTDPNRTMDFVTGKEVTLTVDGQKLFGGILLQVTRRYAFPVVDTSVIANVQERMWDLSGADYNIWFDKLVLRNTSNYLRAIRVDKAYDGHIISQHLPDYLDYPSGMNFTDEVDNVAMLGLNKQEKFAFPTQGTKWRDVMEDMRARSGATYYIDANKKLHWHPVGKTLNSWGLTDVPGMPDMVSCRDVVVSQDGSQMVTDALVWTGNQIYADNDSYQSDGAGLYFYRFPDPPASRQVVEGVEIWKAPEEQKAIDKQAQYGRWQYAEHNFGEGNSPEKGARRALYIVNGPAGAIYGIEGGLGQPLWDIQATWFGHHVPGGAHIPAGYLVNLIFYGLGTSGANPLVQCLPMRFCSISFPTIPESPTGMETYVQFSGRFSVSYSDHRRLWKMIKQGREAIEATLGAYSASTRYSNLDADAGGTPSYGAFLKLDMSPVGGSSTVYTADSPYIAGTVRVFVNGLLQRPGREYSESSPETGQITFYSALLPTDTVFIEARSAGDQV